MPLGSCSVFPHAESNHDDGIGIIVSIKEDK